MTSKYVVVSVGPLEVPIVFPEDVGIPHRDVAVAFWVNNQVISAGCCDLATGRVWGQSASLQCASRCQLDRQLIERYFRQPPEQTLELGIHGLVKLVACNAAALPKGCIGYIRGSAADAKGAFLMSDKTAL